MISDSSKSSDRIPVIHIGMPKAASKTLQWRLFAAHSEIYYLGRYDGPIFNGLYLKYDACRDATVQALMKHIAYGNVYNPDFPHCRELLAQVLAPAKEKKMLPVWSWESYATDISAKRRVRARNLKEVFGEVKIIMVLRNPLSLLESAYFQVLKRENVVQYSKVGRPLFSYSIQEWLERYFDGEIMPHLQYAETVKIYSNLFGVENIAVFLFEDLVRDPRSFIEKICLAMGIDVDEGVRLTEKNANNERWTTTQLDLLQKIKQSKLESLIFRLSNKKKCRNMLGLDQKGIPINKADKACAPIPAEWQEKIFSFTAKGNRWLEQVFKLPLAENGYFG